MLAPCAADEPCAAERWRDAAGQDLDLLRRAEAIEPSDPPDALPGGPWRTRWRTLGDVLGACLGDPLDPRAGRRVLVVDETGAAWLIQPASNNVCGIQGEIRLDLLRDRVDATAVRCAPSESKDPGLPWASGGLQCAREHLETWMGAHADELLKTAPEAQRASLERYLKSQAATGTSP